jgi:hypothetical protein
MQSRVISPIASHVSTSGRKNNVMDDGVVRSFPAFRRPLPSTFLRSTHLHPIFGSTEVANRFRSLRMGMSDFRLLSSFHKYCSSRTSCIDYRFPDENAEHTAFPPGKGSLFVLSAIHLPLLSIRLAVLGREYLDSIHKFRTYLGAEVCSEHSWPETECSFVLVENDE